MILLIAILAGLSALYSGYTYGQLHKYGLVNEAGRPSMKKINSAYPNIQNKEDMARVRKARYAYLVSVSLFVVFVIACVYAVALRMLQP